MLTLKVFQGLHTDIIFIFCMLKNVDHIWLILTHQRSDKDHKNITPIMMCPF